MRLGPNVYAWQKIEGDTVLSRWKLGNFGVEARYIIVRKGLSHSHCQQRQGGQDMRQKAKLQKKEKNPVQALT